ncbi:MAG TPA: glycosyltransferase [Candidatus Sumerlaeota bacterium]|nr:glycosyltransferase [Candidatus Sumerlaeota bacterium]HOR27432.1 glycosyltransferase [Candidatus Sumerlaeota bacterium]HPK02005.1 glycosyltransferase [Candidatus Sumerlaeota bacterium]
MRVLHVIDSLRLGGAQTYLLSLLRELGRLDVDCAVAALWGPQSLSSAFAEAGFAPRELARSRFDARLVPRLRAHIRRLRPDVVHAHLIPSVFLTENFRNGLGIERLVTHVHATPGRARGYQRPLERRCFRNADLVVACSRAAAARLPRADRVEVVVNGVDADRFRPPTAVERAAVRRHWGIADEAIVVGTVGRLAPVKNQHLILQAAARLAAAEPRLRVLLVGEGPCAAGLRAEAHALGLGERVIFTGLQRDVAPLLGAMDIFMLPSAHEGLPLGLIEAMACARPVIASRLPGIEEVDGDSGSLVLVQPEPDDLAQALGELIQSEAARSRRGEAARRRVQAAFSVASSARRLASCYRDLRAA